MSTEAAAAAVAVAPASFFVPQSDPSFLVFLLTTGFVPGPDWPLVALGADVAVVAVSGMEVAAVVAAAEVENGYST